jgi:hypothetical protein
MKTAIIQNTTPAPIQSKYLRQFAFLESVFVFFFGARLVAFFAMPQIPFFK